LPGLLRTGALAAAAALCGCSADGDGVAAVADATPVEVTASVEGGARRALSRAGADVQSTAFALTTTQNAGSKLCVMIDGNNGNYVAKSYDITNTSTNAIELSGGQTAALFPAGVNTVNVYGWFPHNGGSKTFSVNEDQTSDANYALSDALFAVSNTCTRTANAGSWNVTPAALVFKHVMSKLSLTVTPGSGVKIKSVVLKNLYKTTTLSEDKSGNTVTGFRTGSNAAQGNITLYDNADGSSSAVTCAGVFPAQSVASTADFIVVTASYGGEDATVTYKVNADKTFVKGESYTGAMTVNGGEAVQVNGTVTINDWTPASENPTLSPDKPSL